MASVSVGIAPLHKQRGRNKGYEQRIKQLLSKNSEIRERAEYFEQAFKLAIPLLPKQAVARILEVAKEVVTTN